MILLNNVLGLPNPNSVKLRFNLQFGTSRPAIDYFTDQCPSSRKIMLDGQYWNYKKKKSFNVGNVTLGFVSIPQKKDCWLLFHVGKVIKDLNIYDGVGYEYQDLPEYDKFIGRVVVRFKNRSQNLIRLGATTLKDCVVEEILPDVFNNDFFPGYANVNVSWRSLQRLITKPSWISALRNQKGVYLLIDGNTGKQYVGSAYGNDMLLSRWECYISTCHGNNKQLKKLKTDYIKDNFYFSVLETFNQQTDDRIIIERENHWKNVLKTRKFGYNSN